MAELVDYKNELNTHVVKNNLIDKIVEKINKIPKHHELRLNPELILLVCNIVENTINGFRGLLQRAYMMVYHSGCVAASRRGCALSE